MKKISVIIYFLCISHVYGFETWVHRIHEYGSTKFEYSKNCQRMDPSQINTIFNFSFLQEKKFPGVEVDVVYNKSINDLVIYHGDKSSNGLHEDFQCFEGQYLLFKDFVNYIQALDKSTQIWVDLKNSDSKYIENAGAKLIEFPQKEQFIVETQSYLGAFYLISKKLKTSLWVKIRGPQEETLRGKLRMLKNMWRIKFAKLLGVNRISQSCKTMLDYGELFKNNHPKMCWNTNGKRQTHSQLNEIQGLAVVLEAP